MSVIIITNSVTNSGTLRKIFNEMGNKKIPRKKWQWKHDDPKPMGSSKSNSKREVYSNTTLPQETRKTLTRQPNFTPKTTVKRRI